MLIQDEYSGHVCRTRVQHDTLHNKSARSTETTMKIFS